MWLLLIEDESRLAETIRKGLEEAGYVVDVAADGEEGELLGLANAYDALIVDWRLPRRDGRTVIENLRAAGRTYPILMLTALGDLEHKVSGLDSGADDYLSKPFKYDELLARLRALLRRPPLATTETTFRAGVVELDTRHHRVTVRSNPLELRPKEFGLLEELLRHSDEVLSRTIVAERVWGGADFVTDNVLDVTVSGLRQKLAHSQSRVPDESTVKIETVRGIGYRLTIHEDHQ